MTTPTLDSFFSGGGKSVSWKEKPLGTFVSGTVKTVHPPQQQTDPVTQKPVFKRDGVTPKVSVRIDLDTAERDPSDPEDDGSRSLYVQGWMQGAIGDALRRAGAQGTPQPGGTLTVTLVEREPNSNPALSPINKFSAVYVPPTALATQQFFDQAGQQAAQQFVQQQPQPVPGQPAYQAPPQQQYVAPPAAQAAPEKPAQMDAAAWASMDLPTQIAVAKSFADSPPF